MYVNYLYYIQYTWVFVDDGNGQGRPAERVHTVDVEVLLPSENRTRSNIKFEIRHLIKQNLTAPRPIGGPGPLGSFRKPPQEVQGPQVVLGSPHRRSRAPRQFQKARSRAPRQFQEVPIGGPGPLGRVEAPIEGKKTSVQCPLGRKLFNVKIVTEMELV